MVLILVFKRLDLVFRSIFAIYLVVGFFDLLLSLAPFFLLVDTLLRDFLVDGIGLRILVSLHVLTLFLFLGIEQAFPLTLRHLLLLCRHF